MRWSICSPDGLFEWPSFVPQVAGFRRAPVQVMEQEKVIWFYSEGWYNTGGLRPFHQKSTYITRLTSGLYVVRIWSRGGHAPLIIEGTKTFVLHRRPGVALRANLKSIPHRCHLFEVAFVRELTEETIHLPLGCLQGGVGTSAAQIGHSVRKNSM